MTYPTDGPGGVEPTAPTAGSVGVSGDAGSGKTGSGATGSGDTGPAGSVGVGEPVEAAGDPSSTHAPDPGVSGAVGAVAASAGRPESGRLLRLRLDLGYDGTDFSGWAAQPGRRTVAGELSTALALLFRRPVPLGVAGRTDAGVHALGQVAHIDVDPAVLISLARRSPAGQDDRLTPVERGAFGLLRRLAGLLDDDVRVRRITVAPDGFDARFAALRRHYRYRIAATEFGVNPLRRRDTLAWSRPLDVDRMAAAGQTLIGLDDFAAYCKPPAHDGATTIRELQALSVREVPDEPGVVAVDVSADAFCHSMVRSLVGALLAVGDGRMPVARPRELLAARRRTSAVHGAPARGLTLMGVDYPDDAALRQRADLTRAVRAASDAATERSAAVSDRGGAQDRPPAA
ncbi:tRNA pseudouridine(38-40) synthase TruA [Nakamurella deserti]|uniref:tRNA pseudouridine(38-40) synthase TruA n=1 Tax=Nakamurella deserti TaxID=2164074 RepID=UPI00197B2921|nr:tRNA pseudouridine(38-40) synthase TruA [Nakamurella deserti]